MATTGELSAPQRSHVTFPPHKPFPHLPAALAGSSITTPAIVPERLAATDPFRQVPEIVGGGPYRFLAAEFNAGDRAHIDRFAAYVPRGEGTLSLYLGAQNNPFRPRGMARSQ